MSETSQRSRAQRSGSDTTESTESDPLDWVSNHWDSARLGDPTPVLLMTSVLRMHTLMVQQLEQVLDEEHLTVTDYLLLMTLMLTQSRSRPLSGIARAMMVHPTTVTLSVDRMEGAGLVRRQRHETDRRVIMAALTDAGAAKVETATKALHGVSFGASGLSDGEAAELIGLLRKPRRQAGDVDRTAS